MGQNLGSHIIFEPKKSLYIYIYRIQSENTSRISWECSSIVKNILGICYYL